MLRRIVLLCSLFCFFLPKILWSQGLPVTGKILTSTGEPAVSATVKVKGSNVATSTNADGVYRITAPSPNSVLVFTMVGMQPMEMIAGRTGTVNITLQPAAGTLNEVVVVGYGTQTKRVVTGSISSVKAGDLDNQPIARIEQFLQGRASGITVAASSGQPGAAATIRVRGTTTLNGGNDPLYVVDGIPVDIGGIDYLNPNDIESIDVLKDAASAAIYGTRAASGVILVTTKKGRAGRSTVSYNGYFGTQAPARKLKLLNATEYATLRNEASLAGGGPILFSNPASLGVGTDWQSLIFNNGAKIQDHEISISGGNDRSTYYTSFGYFDQEGIVATDISRYKRFNIRLNGNNKVTDWLSVGTNFGYSHIKSYGIGNTNSEYGGPLSSAINLDPITPAVVTDPAVIAAQYGLSNTNNLPIVRDAAGNPYGISRYVGQEMTNPLAYIKNSMGNYGWSDNFVGNAFVEIEPIKGLKVRSNIGAKMAFWGNESFSPIVYFNSSTYNANNAYSTGANRSLNYTWENTASYGRRIGLHNFTVLAGTGTYVDNASSRSSGITYRNLPVNTFDEAKSTNFAVLPANVLAGTGTPVPHKLSSIYARLTYDYAEKYLFTGLVRRDGSTRFGSNNKYGYFPGGSVGWVASKESFWPENKIVNFFKLRGSYGVTGNDASGDFAYVSTIGGNRNYTFGTGDVYTLGFSPNGLANPDLRWEQTSQTDVGFDASLFKNFTLTFDWFNKKTSGILRTVSVPLYVGTGGYTGNVASLENKGVELELGYRKTIGGVFLELKGNASHYQNKITYITQASDYFDVGSLQSSQYNLQRNQVGQAYNSFYGFQTLGIFQTEAEVNSYVNKNGGLIQPTAKPGDFKWADLNGDGQINASDRTYLGNPSPTWSYGFTLRAACKGFDFVAFGQGAAGNKIFNGLRRLDINGANWTTAALNRWAGEGTSTTYPRLTTTDPNRNFSYPSSFYLENGDYFRIKVLQLGYTFPASLVNRAHLQKLRLYVSANNLVTITKYTGYDPEIGGGSYGIDRGFYPQARSFTAGVNLTF